MNKEIIIPIVVGFTVGIIVMYGVVTATRSLRDQGPISPEPNGIPTTTQSTNNTFTANGETQSQTANFTLVSPYPNALVSNNKLIVRGFSSPQDHIVIQTENTTLATTPDDKGEFETEITLEQGSNYLTLFSIDPQGNSKRIDQTVIYATN